MREQIFIHRIFDSVENMISFVFGRETMRHALIRRGLF